MTKPDELVGQFIQHASSSPQQLAIRTSTTTLTYQQLYQEVCEWRDFFKSQDLHRVVVCLDRTPRLIAVLLALQWLKITYIPVDTNMPIERLRFVIQDSFADAFLYDTAHALHNDSLPCKKYYLPDPKILPKTHTKKRDASAPAYIIYTSGSTGMPKGVVISYKALNHVLSAMSQLFLKEEHTLFLAVSTLAFDIAALEIYLPLWQSKTVFLSNADEYRDPHRIKQLLEDYPITHLQATPTMWKLLDEAGWAGNPNLHALCGGEMLTEALANTLLPKVKALWNLYGPTEATIWCASKKIQLNCPITIGKPIEGMSMLVLDANLRPLPPYIKGELYISGIALADGYVNNPALNESRFIHQKRRLYKTGDIASYTPEGEFLVFGRYDNQIKLHGYRIELEEIETQLSSLPNIRECAVSLYNEGLVAYICPKTRSFSKTKALKHLKTILPEYMIPKQLVLLKNLPQTLNGKIDRKRLPPPPNGHSVKPIALTETETMLMGIWLEIFNLQQIDIHQSFFDLGGHSLLAAQMIAQIETQFKKRLFLKDIYHAKTIEKLAKTIEKAPKSKPLKIPMRHNPRWLPLNDFQRLLWIFNLCEPALKKLNIAARKRIKGPIDKAALDLALKIVYEKHEAFSYTISRFLPIQRKRKLFSIRWRETSLIHEDPLTAESHLNFSFDQLYHYAVWPKNQPNLIAKIFYLKNDEIEFQLAMPHFIADETSAGLLFEDLSHIYLLHMQHLTASPLSKTFAYSEEARRQHEYNKQYDSRDAVFWKRYLKRAQLAHLPENDVVQTPPKHFAYSTYIQIPETHLTQLHLFCEKHLVTLGETLCAASVLSLKKVNPKLPNRLVFNAVKSTRYDTTTQKSVGCFLQNQICKLDLKKRNRLSIASKAVQQSMLESQAHQQASMLIKLASLGNLSRKKHSLRTRFITVVLKLLQTMEPWTGVNKKVLQASQKLATTKRDSFLLQVNIFPHFLIPPQTETCFGAPCSTSQTYRHDILKIPYQLDMTFLRDEAGLAYLVVSANLTPAYRQKLGEKLLEVIQEAP